MGFSYANRAVFERALHDCGAGHKLHVVEIYPKSSLLGVPESEHPGVTTICYEGELSVVQLKNLGFLLADYRL